MRLFRKPSFCLVVAGFAAYLLFSLLYPVLPGPEHDEMIFVNAALGNADGTFIEWSWKVGRVEIPIMIMRYIGAVKSYIHAPIFALFGTSIWTARLPVVFFGILTLVLTYKMVRSLFGPRVALLSLILLATDPSFIFSNRLDWGPVSLMMVFKSATLYLLFRWLNEGKVRLLALSAFIMGLGVFDKIVFVWFLGALGLAFPLCFWPRLKPRLAPKAILIALACFLAGCGPFIAYNLRFPLLTFRDQKGITTSWPQALKYRYNLMRETLDGSIVLSFINEQAPPEELEKALRSPAEDRIEALFTKALRLLPFRRSLTPIAFLLALILIFPLRLRSRLREQESVLFFLLLYFFITVFICITAEATGSHHMIMLYPFHLVLIAYSFCEAQELTCGRAGALWRKLACSALGAGLGLTVLSSVVVDMSYIKSFKVGGGDGRWSSAMYRLAEFLRQNPDRHFLLMDWGFSTQLLVLNNKRINYEEAFVRALDSPTESAKIDCLYPYLFNPGDLFVFHTGRYATFPTFDIFRKTLEYYGLDTNVVESISQRNGSQIYFLSDIDRPELQLFLQRGNYFYFREAEEYDACSGGEVDYKAWGSRLRVLGYFWGRNSSDFVTYRWPTDRTIANAALYLRYSSEEKQGLRRFSIEVDGKRAGVLLLDCVGKGGYEKEEWKMARGALGNLEPGRHELTLRPLEPNQSVILDFLYVSSGDFDLPMPQPSPPSLVKTFKFGFYPEIQGFDSGTNVKLVVSAPEVYAGQSKLSLRVMNLNARAIDILYTLNGEYMPLVHKWKLDQNDEASVFVNSQTPKGLYVYKAIRNSEDRSPSIWHRVNVPVLVK